MRTKIQLWGNSLALRIPRPFAEETGLGRQSEVELSVTKGRLVVVPVKEPRLTLDELLARVTDENLHSEIDTGPAVGNEAW